MKRLSNKRSKTSSKPTSSKATSSRIVRPRASSGIALPDTSRRRFMQAAGLLGGAAMLPSMKARAQATPPKRIVVLFSSGGWNPRTLQMRPPGAPAAWSEYDLYDHATNQLVPDDMQFDFDLTGLTQAEFSPGLAPLHRHRNKMLVTEGLAYLSTRYEDGDAHASAHLASLSGAFGSYVFDEVKCHGSHPSIDQLISDHIRATDSPLHQPEAFSLPVYGGRHQIDPFHSSFYRWTDASQTGVSRVPFGYNPVTEFNRIFAGVNPSGEMPSPQSLAQSDIFNAVSSHYASLLPRLSTADRQRLDAHRTMLMELQQSLVAPVASGCQLPDEPGPGAGFINDMFVEDLHTWFDMTAAAFSCDLTRVVSIRDLQWMPNSVVGVDDATDWHHDIDHHSGPEQEYTPDAEYLYAADSNTAMDAQQATWVANLCDRLDAIPEADGTTMLDNTLVLWVKEMSHGNHGHEHYHTVMLGNVGGHFSTGRYIKYPQNNPNPWHRNYRNEFTGTPYNHYLISILQAFGLSQNAMGGITSVDASVPHLNITGSVDMTGPLWGLTNPL